MLKKLKEKEIERRNRIVYPKDEFLYQEILKSILRGEYDFIAFVVSHWHAVGVDAFVYEISKRKNKKPAGIIIIQAHSKNGFLINEKDFICKDFSKIDFYFLDNSLNNLPEQKSIILKIHKKFEKFIAILSAIHKIKKQNNSNKKELYIVSVMNPYVNFLQTFRNETINNKYSPVFSLIDEGLGTYASNKTWKIKKKLDNQNKRPEYFGFVRCIKLKIIEIANNYLKKLALKYINTERRFLFCKKNNDFVPNWAFINSYKKVFKKRNKCFANIKKVYNPIIIITNPYSEYKLASLKYELNIVKSIINILIRKGFNVVIKPHPREVTNKYLSILKKYKSKNVKLIRQDFPIEDLFLSLEPLCVIGYASTALINANIMYGIPVISIRRLFLNNESEEIKRKLLKGLNGSVFEKLSKGRIYNVDNFEKLEDILNLITSKKHHAIKCIR